MTMAIGGGTVAYWRFPRYPDDDISPHALPDVLFTVFPEYCPKIFGQNIQSFVLLIYYAYLVAVAMPMHENGRLVLQRFFLLNSLMFLTRTTTVGVTSLPQPNFTAKCLNAQSHSSTFLESLHIVVGTTFPPKACGDLIYSGHASCAIMAHLVLERTGSFFRKKWLRNTSLALIAMAVVSIFMCRSHYTVDVVLAVYFSFALTEFYHLWAEGVLDGGQIGRFIRWMEGDRNVVNGKLGKRGFARRVVRRKSLEMLGDEEDGGTSTDTFDSDGTPPSYGSSLNC